MLDDEIRQFIALSASYYPDNSHQCTVLAQRRLYNLMCEGMRAPRPDDVSVDDLVFDTPTHQIPIRRYTPASALAGVVVLYFHGGGFVVGGLDSHDDICAELASRCAIKVQAVDYRLAPEHCFPSDYNDVQAIYQCLYPDHEIILCGDSAGASLAAGLALNEAMLGHSALGQVLIYPALGGYELKLDAYERQAHAPMLSTEEVAYYHQMRMGGQSHPTDARLHPLLAPDLSASPACFAFAAQYDPLCDDVPHYVRRLQASGVMAEATVEPGLVHGYLRARHRSKLAAASFERIIQAIKRCAQLRRA